MDLIAYGEHPSQCAELHLPPGDGPHPVVVLVHGGFWRQAYDSSLMVPLAVDLRARGFAVANLEFRRVGQPGGGWPGTFLDVAAGVDRLGRVDVAGSLDLEHVVTVGHSAGGHLALWLAARPGLPAGCPGAEPLVRVTAAVSLAGVADLRTADAESLGRGAAAELLGGGAEAVPDRYALASPRARLPLGVPQLLVHGDADDTVPVTQSENYAAAARAAGDDVELVALSGVDHFAVIDPAHAAWRAVLGRLETWRP